MHDRPTDLAEFASVVKTITVRFAMSVAFVINPRRACARVTVVCVSVSVYLSVPALAASASVEDSKQRYSRVSLRLFLDFDSWIFEKPLRSKVIARKSQYAN